MIEIGSVVDLRPLCDENEEIFHWAEVMRLTTDVYSQPYYPLNNRPALPLSKDKE